MCILHVGGKLLRDFYEIYFYGIFFSSFNSNKWLSHPLIFIFGFYFVISSS
jgi:hypothetical protein